jgi:hypothetical protein
MKPVVVTLAVCLFINGCGGHPQPSPSDVTTASKKDSTRVNHFKADELVEELHFDADRDGRSDTLRLFRLSNWSDPGDFHYITIGLASGKHFSYPNEEGWASLAAASDTFAFPALRTMSKVSSANLFLVQIDSSSSTILLFGYAYASSPGKLTAIRLSRDSIVALLDEEIAISSVGKEDYEAFPFLVCNNGGEAWGNDSVQYSTYVESVLLSFIAFKPVSQETQDRWIADHMVLKPPPGVAGPYVVVHLRDRGPFVMNEAEAYRRYGK